MEYQFPIIFGGPFHPLSVCVHERERERERVCVCANFLTKTPYDTYMDIIIYPPPTHTHAHSALPAQVLTRGGKNYYQINVTLPPGFTLHSSIWLIANTHAPARSGCGQEIDVVEQYATEGGPVSSAVANLHPYNGTKAGPGGCQKVPYTRVPSTARGDWTSNWTVFAVDWTESYIAMTVNGEAYANFDTQQTAVGAFTDPLFLALTACVMNRVPLLPLDVLPLQYEVDWVKVYAWT